MKAPLYPAALLVLLFVLPEVKAQENLIPNPSFEEFYGCDHEFNKTLLEDIVPGWAARVRTPQYIHPDCEVPLRHEAYDGQAYILQSLHRYQADSSGWQIRNYSQTRLNEALVPGQAYYLEYYLRVNFEIAAEASHQGILFSDSLVLLSDDAVSIPVYPILTEPQLVVDTLVGARGRWARIWHCFTPQEAHQVMTVGIFEPIDNILFEQGFVDPTLLHAYDAFYLIEVEDTLRLNAPQDTICAGDCISISSNHSRLPGTFRWELPGSDIGSSTDSAVTACYLQPGVYDIRLEVDDCHGTYDSTFRQAVVVLERPVLTAPAVQRFRIAAGDSLPLTSCRLGDSLAVHWQPQPGLSCTDCPDPVFTGDSSATLLAIAGHASPCPDTCRYEIEVLPRAQAGLSAARQTVCTGQCFELQNRSSPGSASLSYTVDGITRTLPPGTTGFELCLEQPGMYTVQLLAENEVSSDTFLLTGLQVLEEPQPRPVPLTYEAQVGEPLTLQPGLLARDYRWEVQSGSLELSCTDCPQVQVDPLLSGEILLWAANGDCTDSLLYRIDVARQDEQMYIPTAFSPNDDGRNDLFQPLGRYFTLRRMQIFDRYGGRLFEARGADAAWDGRARGKPVNTGVYVYLIEYEDLYGEVKQASGEVTVLR